MNNSLYESKNPRYFLFLIVFSVTFEKIHFRIMYSKIKNIIIRISFIIILNIICIQIILNINFYFIWLNKIKRLGQTKKHRFFVY